MARLIILLGPVASALGGVAVGFLVDNLFVCTPAHPPPPRASRLAPTACQPTRRFVGSDPLAKLLMWPLSLFESSEEQDDKDEAAEKSNGAAEADEGEVKKLKKDAKTAAEAKGPGLLSKASCLPPPTPPLTTTHGAHDHPACTPLSPVRRLFPPWPSARRLPPPRPWLPPGRLGGDGRRQGRVQPPADAAAPAGPRAVVPAPVHPQGQGVLRLLAPARRGLLAAEHHVQGAVRRSAAPTARRAP